MLKMIFGLFITLVIVAGTVMSVAIIFSSDGREPEREQQQPLEQQRDIDSLDVNSGGVLLVSQDRVFNDTNPDINFKSNIPQELVLVNKDSSPHDITVESLNIKSGILNKDEEFKTTIMAESGIYEYYCSLHPQYMKGRIIAQ